MKLPKQVIAIAFSLAGSAAFAASSTLAEWNFSNATIGQTSNIAADTSASAGIVVSTLTDRGGSGTANALGVASTYISTNGIYSGSETFDKPFTVSYASTRYLPNEDVNGHYSLNFNLSVESGYSVSLSSLSFALGYDSSYGGTYYAPLVQVYVSPDGLDWTAMGTAQTPTVPSGYATETYKQYFIETKTVDLSGLLTLDAGDDIYVRLVIAEQRQEATAATRLAVIDNIILSGDITAIPEPSTYAIGLGALMVAYVFLRRRRG